jgi:DNA-binding transcriptional MerR regulator
MTYSRDLQELRRLLREGFSIEQIVAKAGAGVSEADSGIEITKTPKGSTANIRYLTDAASCFHPDGPLTVTIRDEAHRTEVRLKQAASERVLCSEEKDFWDFTIAMHPSLDAQGNRVLRRFRDTGRQIEETKRLVTLALDPQKRAEYLRASFDNSKGKVDSNLKTLLLQYLRSADWGASRFLPLRENYFELQEVLLHETRNLFATQKRVWSVNPRAQAYSELVEELLNAFWHQDDTLLKRSMRFVSLVRFDITDAIMRASEQRRHVDDLLGMLARRGQVPGRQGIPHLLDAYRRYCESLRPFIDVLSDAVCAVEKLRPLAPNVGYKKRVAVMNSTQFGAIVRCLDPEIRHSESHGGTVIDDDHANVLLTEIGKDGCRRTVGQYSYWQISDMTLELQNGLFLAVLTSFSLHETGLLLTALVTPEFMSALVSIDNLED